VLLEAKMLKKHLDNTREIRVKKRRLSCSLA